MGKKSKNEKINKNPTVSILTINQIKRQETIVLTAEHINNQTYKNIIEWVIVEGSSNLEDCLENEKFIKTLKCNIPIVYIPGYHLDGEIQVFNGNHLGELRNISNRTSKGEICVCFDDDDFYFKTRVEHSVQMLMNSKAEIAGCSEKYLYDYCLQRLFKFKSFGPNHSTNDCMAYKRSYFENNNLTLSNNSYEPLLDQAEESAWTKKFTNPMVQLDAKHCIIGSSHTSNTFNKREICTFSCLWKNPSNPVEGKMYPQTVDITETAVDLMGQDIFDRYTSIFIKNEESEFDISYTTGGTSIDWDPNSKSLGGSEQAVLHLSTEWVKMGKKVAVYGKVPECIVNGVHFIKWEKFPFHKQHSIVILSRMASINCFLLFPIKTRKLFIDYHDNNFVFRHDYLKCTDRIDKIFFKSDYHLDYYQKHFNLSLSSDKYTIIPNGLRLTDFSISPQVKREPFRFCYCSCYTRGLVELLQFVWPHIFRNYPQAEFHVYYGMDGIQDPNAKQQLTLLMGQPGVMDHGRRPVEEIALEKWKSSFQFYITDTNQEIDCISIRESLITGCVPLISNSGVFKNRDGLHFDLDKSPNVINSSYQRIAQGICNLLTKPDFIEMCRQRFHQSLTIMDWKTIAERWIEFF